MPKLNILITAGPTHETIDPVRYLTNRSSGKMGYALSRAAKQMGHRVLLVTGPTTIPLPPGVKCIPIISAKEMYKAVMQNYKKADVIIKVAAVADYRPAFASNKKIKKTNRPLSLKLIPNPDILKTLGRKKKKNQILVGFAAETNRGLPNAYKKLKEKNCDWIVLNNISKKGIGFGSDLNEVTLLSKQGQIHPLGRDTKSHLAKKILKIILERAK